MMKSTTHIRVSEQAKKYIIELARADGIRVATVIDNLIEKALIHEQETAPASPTRP
jgi:hypothetical protein